MLSDPAVSAVTAAAGSGGFGNSSNTGNMFISLKPPAQRVENGKIVSSDEVINRLRRKLSLPGTTLFLQTQQELSMGGRRSDAQYQYTLSDENINELNTWAPRLQAKMAPCPNCATSRRTSRTTASARNL